MNLESMDDLDLLLRADLEVEDLQEISSWTAGSEGSPPFLCTPTAMTSCTWNDTIRSTTGSAFSFQPVLRSSRKRSISPRAGKPKSPRVTYKDKLNELLVIKTIIREKNALSSLESSAGSDEPSYESAADPFEFTSQCSLQDTFMTVPTSAEMHSMDIVSLPISDPMHPRYAGICPTTLKHGRSKNKKQKTEVTNPPREESLTMVLSDVTDEELCSSPSSNSSTSCQSFEEYEWDTAEAETLHINQPLVVYKEVVPNCQRHSSSDKKHQTEPTVRTPRSPRNIPKEAKQFAMPPLPVIRQLMEAFFHHPTVDQLPSDKPVMSFLSEASKVAFIRQQLGPCCS